MPYYNEEDKDINKLKCVLMSLVASSRQQMDMRLLLKEYRSISGYMPIKHYGYTSPFKFLREQLSDCFVFGEPESNPKLTLKEPPPALQHIDQTMKPYRKNSKFNGKSQNVTKPDVVKLNVNNTPRQPQQASNTASTHRENRTCATAKKDIKKKKPYKKQNKAAALPPLLPIREPDSDWDDSGDGENGIMNRKLVTVGPDGTQIVDVVGLKRTFWKLGHAEKMRLWKEEEPLREVRSLVLESPKGIWCSQLLRLYRERYGRELDYSAFYTLPHLMSKLPDVKLTYFSDRGDTLLIDQRRRILYSPTPDVCVFPLECMQLGDTIRPHSEVAQTFVGHTMEVIVTEVYSPSVFWLQRIEDTDAIEKLQREMIFYYTNGAGDPLHPEAVQVGTYCACAVGGDYRRSVIVKLMDNDENFRKRTVKVLQVDYGVVKTVPARMLLPMRREFARLHTLAIRARLAGVRPRHPQATWRRGISFHFDELVNGRRASATVTAVDLTDLSLEVDLLVENEELTVAAELLLALDAEPRYEPAIEMQMPFLFPGFSAVEKNATPNLSDIRELLRDGVDICSVEESYKHMLPKCLHNSASDANQPPPPHNPASPNPRRRAVRFNVLPWMNTDENEATQVDSIARATENVTHQAENVTLQTNITPYAKRVFHQAENITPYAKRVFHQAENTQPYAKNVAPPAVHVSLTSEEINEFLEESKLSPASNANQPPPSHIPAPPKPPRKIMRFKFPPWMNTDENKAPQVDSIAPVAKNVTPQANITPYAKRVFHQAENITPYAKRVFHQAENITPYAKRVFHQAENITPYAKRVFHQAENITPYPKRVFHQAENITPYAKRVFHQTENITPYAKNVAPPAVHVTLTSEEINEFLEESKLSPASNANQPPPSHIPAPPKPPRKVMRFPPWMNTDKNKAPQVDSIAPAVENVTPQANITPYAKGVFHQAENITPYAKNVAPPAMHVTLTSEEINQFIEESKLSPALANFYMTMILRQKVQLISESTGEQSPMLAKFDLLL